MRITDLLKKESISLNRELSSKSEAIDALIDLQEKAGNLNDKEEYKKGILAREEQGSTAIGNGIAIPHAKTSAVAHPGLSAVTAPSGVDYNALDGKPSNLLFMIAAPEDGDLHLEVLSRLMTMLMDETFRNELLSAKTADEFISVIDRKESEKYPENPVPAAKKEGYRILAVTACPTGIAHTYMAAEALEKAGEEMGIPLKAETNGSGGAKNVLTKEEIAAADGIIIAADKSVEMGRFDGKKLISVKVSDGIKKPKELIERVMSDSAPVYHHTGAKSSEKDTDTEGFGRKIYKHLMNGVSNMLPFVVAGGIFIALAFLIDTLMGAPQDANFGTNSPVAAFFKTIGGYAFNFMIPVLSAFIAKSIADRPGFLVGLVGGFLATTGSTFTAVGGDVPSGFLGALFAGFVGGYLMLGVEKLLSKLPKSLEGIKPVLIFPLVGIGLIAVIMCAVNPIMGMLNTGLTNLLNSMGSTSKVLLGVVLGAMMSTDMGGPFNKAAYVFGTAAITSGNYDIMAAVMVGGMVPPLAIALATTFFKKKFTAQERKSGPVNYILGLSFITEGAIPYAASDPLRVIPACMIGAGLAGGLSMLFKCTLMAPHGGIFVFAVVGNWPYYLLALAAGSVVSMLLLGLFKKKVKE
ncbi:MAG: fructose-specific PTS transporter subunit EIIC [Eubacteriales bacterium]|nr:fructose-specific PTS transporter subunit EIIC [Eubacteriales bacterium]